MASGMAFDLEGNLLICEHGQGDKGGYIQRLDLKRLNTSIVADNWFGVPFNSPNDVVAKRDGSISGSKSNIPNHTGNWHCGRHG